MRFEGHPSGTSTAVGPSFFVGQNSEPHGNNSVHEATNILRRLAWLCAGTAALFVVAVLEWQTWQGSKSFTGGRETVAVAQDSAQGRTHPDAQLSSERVSMAAAPMIVRTMIAPASGTQPAITGSPSAAATLRQSSAVRKIESAHNENLGQEGEVNDSTRVKRLRAAMWRGDADAPVSLANLYLEGKEVSRSCDQALRLLESAAERPNARARNRLAAMYEIGTCVQRDRVQAYHWLSSALAADRNNSWAQQNLAQTWREMTSEERTMAEAYR
jgi:TPR repeat protein